MKAADPLISTLTEYVVNYNSSSEQALDMARLCLADALGCAIAALDLAACKKVVEPLFSNTQVDPTWLCHIIGTSWQLDPIQAAFSLGSMIRWLDYNDTWLAKEWAHPSDNLGGIIAACEVACRQNRAKKQSPLAIRDLLKALVQAYEIQGILAISNSFNSVGLDHVILVKVATAAVVAKLLGGSYEQIEAAISHAFIDLGPLRTYRHAPNVGARKSWAAGDATSRGLFFAILAALKNERGYKSVLTAKRWGLEAVIFDGKPLTIERPLESYVVENILFKVRFPAEFHAQTAVEIACALHPQIKGKLDQIKKIDIETHEAALRIIDKKGALQNPADRDHCLQYMVAIALLKGNLTAQDYEEKDSLDPRIDMLRDKMVLKENSSFTHSYHDSARRGIANSLQITFNDGSSTERCMLEFPIGHKRRRQEAEPLLWEKFNKNISSILPQKAESLLHLMRDDSKLLDMPIDAFLAQWI